MASCRSLVASLAGTAAPAGSRSAGSGAETSDGPLEATDEPPAQIVQRRLSLLQALSPGAKRLQRAERFVPLPSGDAVQVGSSFVHTINWVNGELIGEVEKGSSLAVEEGGCRTATAGGRLTGAQDMFDRMPPRANSLHKGKCPMLYGSLFRGSHAEDDWTEMRSRRDGRSRDPSMRAHRGGLRNSFLARGRSSLANSRGGTAGSSHRVPLRHRTTSDPSAWGNADSWPALQHISSQSTTSTSLPSLHVNQTWRNACGPDFPPLSSSDLQLHFVEPAERDGMRVAVSPSTDLEVNAEPWNASLVGYVMDKKPPFIPVRRALDAMRSPLGGLEVYSREQEKQIPMGGG